MIEAAHLTLQTSPSQNSKHYYIADLLTYKTQPCKQNKHHPLDAPYFYNCPYYHTHADKRRNPYSSLTTNKWGYSSIYIADQFSGDTCANWIEYQYHPEVYKTKQCLQPNCHKVYCPKLHSTQQPSLIAKPASSPPSDLHWQSQQQFQALQQNMKAIQFLKSNNLAAMSPHEFEAAKESILQIAGKLKQCEQSKEDLIINVKKTLQSLATEKRSGEISGYQEERMYTEFYYGEQLDIIEDRHHEFKMFRDKDPKKIATLVLEYISAFLNSEGGTIFLGISDESIVYGLEVSQKWLDQFMLAIDSDGKLQLSPPLIPQKYRLRIIPVKNKRKYYLNVVEIHIYPQSKQESKILTLFNRECYLRMNSSNHRLSASDIMEYMRLNNGKKNNDKVLDFLQSADVESVDGLPIEQLRALQEAVSRYSSRIESAIKKKQAKNANGDE